MTSNSGQIYCLQLMRAIAATSVVYLHTFTLPLRGSFGLDLFFVISGFVMCMIIERTIPTPLEFFMKRLTRIVPLYWMFTTAVLAVAWTAPHLMGTTVANFDNYLKSLLFMPHFRQDGQLFPVLMPGWTLNFEMLFYFLICTALMLYRRHFVALVSLVLVMIYGLGYFYPAASVGRVFFHDSLWLEFVLGMACFRLFRHHLIRAVPKIIYVLVLMVSATVLVYFENWVDRFISAGLPCFLILLSALQFEECLKSMHSSFLRFLVHIGDASYATYLSHMFVIGAVERLFFRSIGIVEKNMATALFTITCCLVVGSLVYKLIDAPIVEMSRRFTKRLRFAFS